ncbi:MAG: hypothetical protein ACLFQQ_17970 [Desulfococcaceae bacterium]
MFAPGVGLGYFLCFLDSIGPDKIGIGLLIRPSMQKITQNGSGRRKIPPALSNGLVFKGFDHGEIWTKEERFWTEWRIGVKLTQSQIGNGSFLHHTGIAIGIKIRYSNPKQPKISIGGRLGD